MAVASQAWWLMPVISAFGRLRQEDCHEFHISLGYTLSQKQKREILGDISVDKGDHHQA